MWRSGYFSAVGTSHVSGNIPCQDSVAVDTSEDGAWLAATVCDGAGSAKYAAEGSQYVSSHFNSKLLKLAERLRSDPPGGWVNDAIIRSVIEVRDGLRLLADGDDIADYHTTLVAVLLGSNGGFSVHIGDGVAFAGEATEDKGSKNWVISRYSHSAPENGEYANETFFITESGWLKHLRVLPLPRVNWAVLATDGGAEFLIDRDRKSLSRTALEKLFIDSISQDGDRVGLATQALSDRAEIYLSDEAYGDLTSDDKTLAVIIREDVGASSLRVTLPLPDLKPQAPQLGPNKLLSPDDQPIQQITTNSGCLNCARSVLRKVSFIIKRSWRWILLLIVIALLGVGGYWACRADIFGVNRFIELVPSKGDNVNTSTRSTIGLDLPASVSKAFSLHLSVKSIR